MIWNSLQITMQPHTKLKYKVFKGKRNVQTLTLKIMQKNNKLLYKNNYIDMQDFMKVNVYKTYKIISHNLGAYTWLQIKM